MTTAAKNANDPSEKVERLIDEVQEAADKTQSEAFHYIDYADGSRLEVRCFPTPLTSGSKAPKPSPDVAGKYHRNDHGKIFKCVALPTGDPNSEYTLPIRVEADNEDGYEIVESPVEYRWVEMPDDANIDLEPELREIESNIVKL